jgi:hypothetical protein
MVLSRERDVFGDYRLSNTYWKSIENGTCFLRRPRQVMEMAASETKSQLPFVAYSVDRLIQRRESGHGYELAENG